MEIKYFHPGTTYLRVKIKSLAAEARIIRKEERLALEFRNRSLYDGLHTHRVRDVRDEARATQLAYAILRGRDYRDVEPNARQLSDWDFRQLAARIVKMVTKYGGRTYEHSELKAWMDAK